MPASEETVDGFVRLSPRQVGDDDDLLNEVAAGLAGTPRRLSSRFFYDDEGSRLFQRITQLETYYPTRTEMALLQEHSAGLAERMPAQRINVVDLGAGDGHKTEVVLRALLNAGKQVRYVPIDISESAMRGLVDKVSANLPQVEVAGVVAEYFDGLRWLGQQSHRRSLVMFLGSNIGNFNGLSAGRFLRQLQGALHVGDYVMVGFDMKKDIRKMIAAYDDPDGVTARFNLNLLTRINRELDANFDLDHWVHHPSWDPLQGAMVSHLVSTRDQEVFVGALDRSFAFEAWEAIHTEFSYKYSNSEIARLAEVGGYERVHEFRDAKGWFCDALWRVVT
ncbi:MAG: L-histidine N-alpha-methyltransferase [Kiritimatiellia bacterium]|jgi:L-histidine N-alpha-methyltransferase